MKSGLVSAIVLTLALGAAAYSQDANPAPPTGQNGAGGGQGQRGGRGGGWGGGMGMGGGRGVLGTVTEVTADHYTIKTDAGENYTVHFSANTRIMKAPARRERGEQGAAERGAGEAQQGEPQPLKPADIKVGDAITAAGEMDAAAKSVGAVFILQIDPERAKQMREMQANYGKTWLMGKVTAVDGVKVTIEGGPDNATHTIVADENTSFRKRRDPITLADVQVGDTVRVEGAAKEGSFLATSITVAGQQGPPPSAPPAGQPPAPQPK
jgi:preprotein translocase subunit YajC